MPDRAATFSDFQVYGRTLRSRLILGTAQYSSPHVMGEAVVASGTDLVTVSLRRESARERSGQRFWELIKALGVRVLPNTDSLAVGVTRSVVAAITGVIILDAVFAIMLRNVG